MMTTHLRDEQVVPGAGHELANEHVLHRSLRGANSILQVRCRGREDTTSDADDGTKQRKYEKRQ